MDRRDFLKIAAASAAAAAIAPTAAAEAAAATAGETTGIKVRFLGTGSAQKGVAIDKLWRRRSSVLVEGTFLIDLTTSALDMIPKGVKPATIFYTHSHGDHFDPAAALEAGVSHVLVHQSWLDVARQAFAAAAHQAGKPMPSLEPLVVGCHKQVGGVTVTPLPANHATGNVLEQPCIFLLEKGATRLLYATDTSGLMAIASRVGGFNPGTDTPGLTGLIMEATLGRKEEHHSLFTHSSLQLVQRTVRVLQAGGQLHLPEGQPVWITHLAKGPYGGATPDEINAQLPQGLRAASDGLEVTFH